MSRLATTWRGLRAWSASHGAELRLCVRSTTAGVLTLAAAQMLHLPIALWAVLTAVILTQISIGRSLKAWSRSQPAIHKRRGAMPREPIGYSPIRR